MADDLDTRLDRLYAAAPEDFVAARDALAKELSGEERKVVKALRRPSVVAALANRLAREEPGRVQELLDAGTRLRDAQLGGSGDIRAAMAAERAAVDGLVRAARGLGTRAPTVDRLRTLLRGTAGDDGLRAALARGRLEREPAAGGAWPATTSPKQRTTSPKQQGRNAGTDDPAAQDARRRREREAAKREQARLLGEARERRRERAAATTRAEKDAGRAQTRLERATAATTAAREALEAAQDDEAQAREAAQRALRALKAAQAQLQEAQDDERAVGGASPASA